MIKEFFKKFTKKNHIEDYGGNNQKCIECEKKIDKTENTKYVQITKLEVAYYYNIDEPQQFAPRMVGNATYICATCWNSSAPKHYRFKIS